MNMETPSAEIVAAQVAEMNRLFAAHDDALMDNRPGARSLNTKAQRIKADLLKAGVKLRCDTKGFFSVKQEQQL